MGYILIWGLWNSDTCHITNEWAQKLASDSLPYISLELIKSIYGHIQLGLFSANEAGSILFTLCFGCFINILSCWYKIVNTNVLWKGIIVYTKYAMFIKQSPTHFTIVPNKPVFVSVLITNRQFAALKIWKLSPCVNVSIIYINMAIINVYMEIEDRL